MLIIRVLSFPIAICLQIDDYPGTQATNLQMNLIMESNDLY
jgi:hypothetical protein